MTQGRKSFGELIDEIRAGLVCDRCGRYVGSLSAERYVPPPYPVALDKITPDQEAEALIGFEWHMVNRMRQGNFVIRHPQRDGHCVTFREWVEGEAGEDEDGDEA